MNFGSFCRLDFGSLNELDLSGFCLWVLGMSSWRYKLPLYGSLEKKRIDVDLRVSQYAVSAALG